MYNLMKDILPTPKLLEKVSEKLQKNKTDLFLDEVIKKLENYKTDLLVNEAKIKLEKYKTDLLLNEATKKLDKMVKKKERKKAKSSPREFIKKKMKYKVDKELRKLRSLERKKKTGKGKIEKGKLANFDFQKDFNEILDIMDKTGKKFTYSSKETFEDGRQIGSWIKYHKKKLTPEQLELLGLDSDIVAKYIRLKNANIEKLSKLYENKEIPEKDKKITETFLKNAIERLEKTIQKEEKRAEKNN
jgi:hypothetical protein